MMDDIFSDRQSKREALFKLFDTLPETTILAVVGANGPSGGKAGNQTLWSLRVEFIAWKEESGPLQRSSLELQKYVSDEELRALQQQIPSESLVRLTVKIALDNPFGSPQALLVNVNGEAHDDELLGVLDDYRKPIVFEDPVFGIFTLDKRVGILEVEAEWCGRAINLYASIQDLSEAESAIRTARALWQKMPEWDSRIGKYAVDHLLGLKNDNWLDAEEAEVSAEEFLQRMSLKSISVYPDQSFEFWHEDGDLFWGHSILVSGSISEGPTDADIPG